MIIELIVYHPAPGKLQQLTSWFAEVGRKLFVQHGMKYLSFWTSGCEQENRLIAMLDWENLAERSIKWARLLADPRWLKYQGMDGSLVRRVETTLVGPADVSGLRATDHI